MTINNIILAVFCLSLIANAITLVRHWRMLRAIKFLLTNFAEQQRQFNETVLNEQRKRVDRQ